MPYVLGRQIFPHLDEAIREEKIKIGSERTVATMQFLELLKYLRDVFIQDSCLLTDMYPDNELWQGPIFKSEEYKNYKAELLSTIKVCIQLNIGLSGFNV